MTFEQGHRWGVGGWLSSVAATGVEVREAAK